MPDRSVAPPFVAPQDFELVSAQRVSDTSGSLFVVNVGEQPIVRLEWIYKAGMAEETTYGTQALCARMITEGTTTRTGEAIAEAIASAGATLEARATHDYTNLTLHCLNHKLEQVLPLLDELSTQATFPIQQWEKHISQTSEAQKINLEKTATLAGNLFKEKYFGDKHPYGYTLQPDAIQALKQTEGLAYYQQHIQKGTRVCVASGMIDPKTEALLKTYAGRSEAFVKEHLNPKPQTTGLFVAEKEGAMQSSIRMGGYAPAIHHPHYMGYSVLVEVLGGYFGSRLMKNIREDKGYTYGVYARMVNFALGSYMVIGLDVKREITEAAIDEIKKEVQLLKTEPVPADELEVVKNYLLGSYLSSITTPFSIADKFKTVFLNQLPDTFYTDYTQTIRSITSEQLLELANVYFDTDTWITAVGGALR